MQKPLEVKFAWVSATEKREKGGSLCDGKEEEILIIRSCVIERGGTRRGRGSDEIGHIGGAGIAKNNPICLLYLVFMYT